MARRLALLPVVLFPAVWLFGQAGSAPADFTFSIPSTHVWTDTGLDLQSGDLLQISASTEGASVPDRHAIPGTGQCDPKGTTAATTSGSELPLASAPAGALIAKLHEQQSIAVLVGTSSELRIEEPSHLFLGVNIAETPACQGSFRVTVHRTGVGVTASGSQPVPASVAPQGQALTPESNSAKTPVSTTSASSADKTEAQPKSRGEQLKSQLSTAAQIFMSGQFGTGKSEASTPGTANAASGASGSTAAEASTVTTPLKVSDSPLEAGLRKRLDSLPRRVNDQFKNLGDMVNFVIVGSEKDVQAALEAANWHVADTDTQKAVLNAVLETYEKKDYLQMPMSTLYLFGRRQDFGYEQAEPIAMVASRHHFRIWKAPFTWKDKEVWDPSRDLP